MIEEFKNLSKDDMFKCLETHDDLYELGIPELSDMEYDQMKSYAKELYPDHRYFNKVGSDVAEGDKVRLPVVLGSLTKTKADGSYNDWSSRRPGKKIAWAKLDGVSIYLKYQGGKLVLASTRGNGEVGKDITRKAKLFCKTELPIECDVELRGEVLLVDNTHLTLGYKTRRNGVAGLLNQDSDENCDNLTVLFYELISSDGTPETEQERINVIHDLGLQVAPYTLIENEDDVKLVEILKDFKEQSPFDIDGLVIAVNDSEREDVYYPEMKVAFKVNEEAKVATVKGIVKQVGRTGRIIPVVNIEPLDFNGVTVEYATGFNMEFIKNSGIHEGAKIGVVRSGDVIPYITEVFEPTNEPDGFDGCPSCNQTLYWKGVDLVCKNSECPAQNILRIEYFLRTLGVEHLTGKTLSKLDISCIQDCYKLDDFEIANLEGFGIKRAEQIINEVQKSLKTTPAKLLAAFGISGIGVENARAILKVYNFEDLWDLTVVQLTKVDGIGTILANNFVSEINNFKELYEDLTELGLKWSTQSNSLKGKTFTLTGNGPIKRDILVKMIESNGGYVKGISKKVDCLVTNDPNSNTGKAKKAREYGVPIIDYEELTKMLM